MDLEVARANMIEQQIRPWNVLEMQTLTALGKIRREDFVPDGYRNLAYADIQIPIGDGEIMLEPKVGARLIENLGVKSDHRILEIGAGTGYLTAILATLCDQVVSIEIDPKLCQRASENLKAVGLTSVELHHGDAFDYCLDVDASGRYDRVLITGSMAVIDSSLLKLLRESGQLVGIEGYQPAMQAVVYQANGDRRSIFETIAPRLRNATDQPEFTF